MKKNSNLTFFLIWFNIVIIAVILGYAIFLTKFNIKSKIYFIEENNISVLKETKVLKANIKLINKPSEKIVSQKIIILPDSIRYRIYMAIDRLNYEFFDDLVKRGINFNHRLDNVNHVTALMQIAQKQGGSIQKKKEIINLLTSNGMDVNLTDKYGKTALFYSIHSEVSELFINLGTELEKKDYEGNTALIKSRSWDHSKMLIKKGANINAQNRSGYSYAMFVAKCLNIDHIKYLINHGANVLITDNNRKNLLMYSTKPEITEYLISLGLDVNSTDSSGKTALHHSISGLPRKIENAEVLINHGSDINSKDWKNITPIMISVRFGSHKITKLLIEKGAEMDFEQMFIRFAKSNKFDEYLANYLFKQGIDVNYQDINGKTAIIHAVERGSRESVSIINFLIENGADINICDNSGQSAIFYTVGFPSRKGALELLILHGANLNIKNKWNKTPLFYAKTNCDSSIVNILINNGAK